MLIKTNENVVLASTSPIRKKILGASGIDFEAVCPDCDEDLLKKEFSAKNPQYLIKDLALFLAKNKALSISKKYHTKYIIGSDQICEFEGKQVSKSKTKEQAISQLKSFSGNIHYQNNAVVIVKDSQVVFSNFSQVELKMRKMSDLNIENYVKYDEPLGCAGSYKYESCGMHLFEEVIGDYHAILGMSLQPILNFLHQQKIIEII